jgi:hypothetical protein
MGGGQRLRVAGAFALAGLALIGVGLLLSVYFLVGLGAGIIVLGPLVYAIREMAKQPPPAPEQRHDAIGDDIALAVERAGRTDEAPRRPRSRDR